MELGHRAAVRLQGKDASTHGAGQSRHHRR
jgi:hypothetical protein